MLLQKDFHLVVDREIAVEILRTRLSGHNGFRTVAVNEVGFSDISRSLRQQDRLKGEQFVLMLRPAFREKDPVCKQIVAAPEFSLDIDHPLLLTDKALQQLLTAQYGVRILSLPDRDIRGRVLSELLRLKDRL